VTSGRLRCPHCGGRLRLWGFARMRWVRDRLRLERIRPRRGRCTQCDRTHVIAPDRTLMRRLDRVEVIGAALSASARGQGYRTISRHLALPSTTVRDWIRRFMVRSAAPPPGGTAGSGAGANDPPPRWAPLLADLVAAGPNDDQFASAESLEALWRRMSRESQGQFLR
jgi:hypothetical protein